MLLRFGVIRASAEDLLLAAQLQYKYKIDCASELEHFCKLSEEFKPPLFKESELVSLYSNLTMIQNHMHHTEGNETALETDQCVSDGRRYFLFSLNRGLARGGKNVTTGEWEWEKLASDFKPKGLTMLMHKDLLLVRH